MQGIYDRLNAVLKTFLGTLAESRGLLIGSIVALIAGIFASPAIRNVAMCAGFGMTIWIAASFVRLRREVETVSRTKRQSCEVPRQATCRDLVLRTLTHLTQIELLVRRPPASFSPQEK